MHPENVPVLTAAGIDFCALANNREAEAPAIFEIPGNLRVIILSCGTSSSGIPSAWSALERKAGVFFLYDLSDRSLVRIREILDPIRKNGDVVVVSIHWGSNWGYDIPTRQVMFAHRLIDEAGVDVVHGHSSHHIRAIEVYNDRPILYGCGDFLNDCEGIGGREEFRADLALMYFLTMDPSTGKLVEMKLVPTKVRRFRVNRADPTDAVALHHLLNREGRQFGTSVELNEDHSLSLRW